MRLGKCRPEPNRHAKLVGRLVQFARLAERKPEREMRFGQGGLQLDSLPQFGKSRLWVSLCKTGQPLRIVSLRKLRVELQRLIQLDDRLRWIPIPEQIDPAEVMRLRRGLRLWQPCPQKKQKSPKHAYQIILPLTCPMRGSFAEDTVPKRLLAKFPF